MKETFGAYLRTKRKSIGLNQAEVARRGGLSRAIYSMYELDRIKQPRLPQLDKLAKGLGVKKEEVRAAYAARSLNKGFEYGETESYPIARGVEISINHSRANLTDIQANELIRTLQIIYKGIKAK